jgi:uncharacterized protein DUF2726
MKPLHPLNPFSVRNRLSILRNRRRNPSQREDRPSSAGPLLRRNQFLSAAERAVYEILRRLAPRHTVFAKVRLSELVTIEEGAKNESSVEHIEKKHLDFVVCDEKLSPVLAIELDHPHGHERDQLVDEVLAAAALPIIHVRAGRRYGLDEFHQLLLPYLRMGTLTP